MFGRNVILSFVWNLFIVFFWYKIFWTLIKEVYCLRRLRDLMDKIHSVVWWKGKLTDNLQSISMDTWRGRGGSGKCVWSCCASARRCASLWPGSRTAASRWWRTRRRASPSTCTHMAAPAGTNNCKVRQKWDNRA